MCFAVPPEVDLLSAAIVEPFACVLHGARRIGGFDASDTVHVYGLGAIGLMAVVQAVHAGSRVIAIDLSEKRRSLALRLGAVAALDPQLGSIPDQAVQSGERADADVVIEASGAPSAQASALESAAHDGRVLFMGLSRPRPEPTRIGLIQERNLTVSASIGAPIEIWAPAIRFVAQAGLDLGVIVSSVLPFAEAPEAFERAHNSLTDIKVMLAPQA
jgi:threonine dehydrogenase-like Zn-dependent dehydrogenase